MKFNKKLLGLALLVLVSCTGSSFSQIAKKKLHEYLASHKDTYAVYMVAQENEVIDHGAVGLFDREKGTKLQENQEMPIASGTKQMTAAMILKLQEKGMLTIDDTLEKFLPADSGWWPENKAPEWINKVTIHQLLTHTSGIAEYIPALKFDVNQPHDKIKHLISEFASTTPLTANPGEKYSYTNTGYFFLGLIIEKLMNKDLATIYKEELFDPLGMQNTHMATLEEAIKFQNDELAIYPKRYFAIPTGAEPQYMPAKVDFYVVPFSDGGVVSSAKDLVIWNKAFHNGKVVSDFSYKLMTTPYNDAHDLILNDVKTGYGVYIATLENGKTVYYHSGRAVGIRSEHGYIPSEKLYFAILSNVMLYETDEMKGKVDYTIPSNQFDISFFRSAIWSLIQEDKK